MMHFVLLDEVVFHGVQKKTGYPGYPDIWETKPAGYPGYPDIWDISGEDVSILSGAH